MLQALFTCVVYTQGIYYDDCFLKCRAWQGDETASIHVSNIVGNVIILSYHKYIFFAITLIWPVEIEHFSTNKCLYRKKFETHTFNT